MRRYPLILILLVFAYLTVDLVAWRLAVQQQVGSPAHFLLIALMRSQLSLLALYVGLGAAHWAWRLGALASGVAMWAGAFLQYDYVPLTLAHTATLFSSLVLPLVVVGGVARARGFLWGQLPERANGNLTSRQFSLGAAFRWMTVSALVLGLAKMAEFPVQYGDLWLRVSLINFIVAIAFLWAMGSATLRLPKFVVMLIVAGGSALLFQDDPNQAWVTKFVLQALLMAGTAEVCRIAGWPVVENPKARMTNDERERLAVSD